MSKNLLKHYRSEAIITGESDLEFFGGLSRKRDIIIVRHVTKKV